MASRKHGTLYVGVTSNLIGRAYQHKTNAVAGFTSRYHVQLLVRHSGAGRRPEPEIHNHKSMVLCTFI